MTLTPTTWIAPYSSPTSIYDVWLPHRFFPHDWAERLELTTSYSIDYQEAGSAAEDRRVFTNRPRRSLKCSLYSTDKDSNLLLQDFMQKANVAGFPMPLYCDVTELTQTSSLTTLNCDTQYRRFYENGRVLILKDDDSYEVAEIDSITSSSLVLKSNMTETKPSGTQIFPLIECDILFSMGSEMFSGIKTIVDVQTAEAVGKQALPASTAIYSTEPVFDYVFNAAHDVELTVMRTGSVIPVGNRDMYFVNGAKGKYRYEAILSFSTRAAFWDFLNFFDSCRGSLKTFLMPSPVEEFTYISHTTTSIKVKAVGEETDWDLRTAISLVLNDDTVYVREISSVSRSAGEDTVSFSTPLPSVASSDILRVCLGFRARFERAEITERWHTGNICEIPVAIIEVQEEKTVNSNVEPIIPELA